MTDAESPDDSIFPPRTAAQITSEFRTLLEEMEETPTELAKRMQHLGDHRALATILRGIQRMASGETGVAGEMLVIARMLVRQQRRVRAKYANLRWTTLPDGRVSVTTDDHFQVTLIPQTRRRWQVNVEHLPTRYSPSWPAWQSSLDAAKRKALTVLGDAEQDLADTDRQIRTPV